MRTRKNLLLLASTTTVPIYGKLADLYGRKPVFLFGTALFLLGSIASGAAQSMEQLIIFRAIQGLGAGAVLPIVLTIIGDIFAAEQYSYKTETEDSGQSEPVAIESEITAIG